MTEELKKVYSSNVVDQLAYDTVELYHPNFSSTLYFIADSKPRALKLDNGAAATFQPFGFSVQRPSTSEQQADMSFSFSNVLKLGTVEVENASRDMSTPIRLTYRVYMDGSEYPQTEAIVLDLANVVVTAGVVSGTASRSNLYARKFPARVFEPWVFKGLVR